VLGGSNAVANGIGSVVNGRINTVNSSNQISIANNNTDLTGDYSTALAAFTDTGARTIGNRSTFIGCWNVSSSSNTFGTSPNRLVGISSPDFAFGDSNERNSIINSSGVTFNNSIVGSTIIGIDNYTATESDTLYVKNLNATGQAYSELYAGGSATGTVAIDWNNSNVQNFALTGNTTFTFANGKSGATYILQVQQSAGGGNVITWPATVKWPGGVPPIQTPTASRADIYTFVQVGSNVIGTFTQNYTI
jgi:hypothetical protein